MRRLMFLVVLFILYGCGSNPIVFDLNARREDNKYCILVKGKNSVYRGQSCSVDDLNAKSEPVIDHYIDGDIVQMMKLAQSKGFSCTIVTSEEAFLDVVRFIATKSDDTTQLLVAMSGEGDDKGFIFNLVRTSAGNFVPPGMRLSARECIAYLCLVKGGKAVIINGCQSGCFVNAAQQNSEFKGVVIAACPVGYATTECQRTGTSAVFAGFLGLYRDDPRAIKNLAMVSISAGFWWENFRHKISDIGAGGLPISYDPIRYCNADFLF